MKKIINGRRYDTDGATCVGNVSHGRYGDLSYWEESLYRKKTGEFFLYGEGGAMSPYRQWITENDASGGEKIKPLSIKEAQKWVEDNLTGEEYETIFGEVDEDKQLISMWVPIAWWAKVKTEADAAGKSATQFVLDKVGRL